MRLSIFHLLSICPLIDALSHTRTRLSAQILIRLDLWALLTVLLLCSSALVSHQLTFFGTCWRFMEWRCQGLLWRTVKPSVGRKPLHSLSLLWDHCSNRQTLSELLPCPLANFAVLAFWVVYAYWQIDTGRLMGLSTSWSSPIVMMGLDNLIRARCSSASLSWYWVELFLVAPFSVDLRVGVMDVGCRVVYMLLDAYTHAYMFIEFWLLGIGTGGFIIPFMGRWCGEVYMEAVDCE